MKFAVGRRTAQTCKHLFSGSVPNFPTFHRAHPLHQGVLDNFELRGMGTVICYRADIVPHSFELPRTLYRTTLHS